MATATDIVTAARSDQKANSYELIETLFEDFFEMHGDQTDGDDAAIIAGLARLGEHPVAVIATQKGITLEERMASHFGSPEPAGYRKALRVMKTADQLNFPIITLINTPGAYPGADAEAAGQGQMIAKNIAEMLKLRVPILTLIIGEAGSGGALALACSDQIWMFENSMYSILSPEGFASIMWKDAHLADKAADLMRLTPEWLLKQHAIHRIIPEVMLSDGSLKTALETELTALAKQDVNQRLAQRAAFFRKF
ncbi:acetyl-coenzyme A carboxylase carboxyl transferase subunit alpha [Secundilactobacillus odoratitofui DSM 19909 = JCM 15043]|uniref:acetyl-CoA carboxytransferase n=1 Tax=Secundilactobacillus odoratitofui DSM 19909 = JCM 15043 TaxID=1423776 RepID=A0A0R1LQ84_9LACO|nr:carboxyl transferase domain-containing protein [Secundilactobacillus odoratitofui]KRK97979.1 acetyl-coenzyme A carboxylase carboxyl transferase subunit alpha [Secundilactobacillus odoratitofui DSM 19909 = JCM 15043]